MGTDIACQRRKNASAAAAAEGAWGGGDGDEVRETDRQTDTNQAWEAPGKGSRSFSVVQGQQASSSVQPES